MRNLEALMVLSNAQKQARWRTRRNKLAKEASSISGLIRLLVRSVDGKSDREIQRVIDTVSQRLRRAMRRNGSAPKDK
jgi:hypothetical protein